MRLKLRNELKKYDRLNPKNLQADNLEVLLNAAIKDGNYLVIRYPKIASILSKKRFSGYFFTIF